MYKLNRLSNGLRLIIVPVSGTKTATILVMIGTGSKYETKKNNGISHFLEHMFFKGTKKRPNAAAISSALDAVGGEYNAFTSKEATGYYVKVDASKIELAADVVADMLLNSKFEKEEIDRERGAIIEEINMYEDNPMAHVEDIFEQCLYGDQPAGWETIGTKDNIKRFKREDFLSYFKSQYGANNAVVCVAGKVNARSAELVKKYFSGFKKSKLKKKLPVAEKQLAPKAVVNLKQTDQAHISLGVRAYKAGHKDEFALRVLATLLGGSMSSRLFINLRERRGLAYYVRTMADFYTDSGYLTSQAGVPIDKIGESLSIIIDEYKKLKEKGSIKEEELTKVKDLMKGRLAIQLESSDNNANWYTRQILLKNKALSPEEFLKKIQAVTASDINRVARDIFVNKHLNLAVIGPYKDKKKFDKILKF